MNLNPNQCANRGWSALTKLLGEASGAFNEPPPSGTVAQAGTRAATCRQGWIKPIMYFQASCNLTLCCDEVEPACFLKEIMRNSLRTRSNIVMITYLKQQSTTNRLQLLCKVSNLFMTRPKTPCIAAMALLLLLIWGQSLGKVLAVSEDVGENKRQEGLTRHSTFRMEN